MDLNGNMGTRKSCSPIMERKEKIGDKEFDASSESSNCSERSCNRSLTESFGNGETHKDTPRSRKRLKSRLKPLPKCPYPECGYCKKKGNRYAGIRAVGGKKKETG